VGDVVKAYAVAEHAYITLEPEELDAIKLETKKTLDLIEFVKVEEIAATAVFLCSDGAASITGTSLSVDGGWVAQ